MKINSKSVNLPVNFGLNSLEKFVKCVNFLKKFTAGFAKIKFVKSVNLHAKNAVNLFAKYAMNLLSKLEMTGFARCVANVAEFAKFTKTKFTKSVNLNAKFSKFTAKFAEFIKNFIKTKGTKFAKFTRANSPIKSDFVPNFITQKKVGA